MHIKSLKISSDSSSGTTTYQFIPSFFIFLHTKQHYILFKQTNTFPFLFSFCFICLIRGPIAACENILLHNIERKHRPQYIIAVIQGGVFFFLGQHTAAEIQSKKKIIIQEAISTKIQLDIKLINTRVLHLWLSTSVSRPPRVCVFVKLCESLVDRLCVCVCV